LHELLFILAEISDDLMSIQSIHQVLTRYWGYSTFRSLQQEIIMSVFEGNDTLALMPTGGGKSICFQVPTMAKDGICIVVSPLIALMKDQVENLLKRNIPATAIVSGMSRNEIDIALDNCIYGREKFLYVSPERLSSEVFLERLQKMNVNLLAIDEAHCISQWGYDFRPAYRKIAEIRQVIPHVPVLALTATATRTVEKDIVDKLKLKKPNVFRKSFERKNLSYVVLYEEDKLNRLLKVINGIQGAGIVYARTRKRTQDVAAFLVRNKIKAEFYHAGLNSEARNKVQDNWMKDKTRIVVATNAFGMGIDKSNVRFVVHCDSPESIEAYYQEAGRAGRDEEKSYAVLLFNSNDRTELEHRLEISFPEINKIKNVYQAIGNYLKLPAGAGKGVSFDFDLGVFCNTYNLPVAETFNCLKILELQGLLSASEAIALQSRIHFLYRAEQLYEFQVKNPALDHFIKVILRSYEGIFDDYVNIKESDLANRGAIKKEEVVRLLVKLEGLKVLSYLPANDKPQLTFLEERLEAKNFTIDRENLADRKKRFLERARAFLNYAESHHRCRSQLLVSYFGETDTMRCGICDYCLERNKADVNDLEFGRIQNEVKTHLLKEPATLHKLIEQIHPSNENKTMRVIEWMIDNEQIGYAEGNLLEWKDD
jgi:ATP-dependent DNA helicase RecQ